MSSPQLKSLRSPDDIFRGEKIEERSVQIGERYPIEEVVKFGNVVLLVADSPPATM